MKRNSDRLVSNRFLAIVAIMLILYGIPLIAVVIANNIGNIKTTFFTYINPMQPLCLFISRSDVKAIGFVLYLIFIIIIGIYFMNKGTSLKTHDEHGSARWATIKEIKNHAEFEEFSFSEEVKGIDEKIEYLKFDDDRKGAGPVVEYDSIKDKGHFDSSNDHVYYEAATGEGKDRRVINPLIRLISDYGENMVINDTKKETYHLFADYLEKERGYQVYCLDYRNPEFGNRFNYLCEVMKYIDDEETEQAEELSNVISATIDSKAGDNEEKIWVDGRRALISSLILSICMSSAAQRCKSLFSCFASLREMGEIVTDYKAGKEMCRLNDWYNSPGRSRIEKNAYTPAKLAQDKTKMSFFVNVATSLKFAANEKLADQMCDSDFSLHDLSDPNEKPIAIFINVPYETDDKDKLGNIFYDSLFRILTQDALKQPGGKLERRVHMIMNEFTNLSCQNSILKKLTIARSSNIRYYFFSQSQSMLEYVYGKEIARSFLDNCKIKIYLSASSYESAEQLSKSVSDYTLVQESISSKNQGIMPTNDVSSTQSLAGKRLITADEIMYDIERGWTIVQKFRLRPIYTYFSDISEIPFFSTLNPKDRLDDEVEARERYHIEEYVLDEDRSKAGLEMGITPKKKKIIKSKETDTGKNDIDYFDYF